MGKSALGETLGIRSKIYTNCIQVDQIKLTNKSLKFTKMHYGLEESLTLTVSGVRQWFSNFLCRRNIFGTNRKIAEHNYIK